MKTNYIYQNLTKAILLLSFSIIYFQSQGLSRYWVSSGSGDWNSTNNWASSSGGASGQSVPTSGDNVFFNSSGVGSCALNATVSVSSITISSGYTGTITQNTGITINVSGLFSQASGTFTGGNSNITFGGGFTQTAGTFTSTSAIFYVSGNWSKTQSAGTFTHNSGTVYYQGASSVMNIYLTETFNNLYINLTTGNTLTIGADDVVKTIGTLTLYNGLTSYTTTPGYFEAQGNVTVSSFYDGGNQPLNFTGTSAQTFNLTGAPALFNSDITIDKTSGTVTLASDLTLDGSNEDLYLLSGTLQLGGYTVDVFYSTAYNTYIYGPTGTNTTFTVAGTGILKGRHFSQIAGTTTSTFTVSGASTFQTYSAFTLSTGTFTSNTATVTIGGNFILNGGTFNATSGTMSCSAEWNRTSAATFNHNNGTVTFVGASTSSTICATLIGTETFYNLTINKDASNELAIASQDTFTILNNLTLTNGIVNATTTFGALRVEGNVTVGIGWDGGNEPLFFSNTNNQNFDLTGAPALFNSDIIIKKQSGTVTLLSNLTLNGSNEDLYLLSGTLQLGGFTVDVFYASNYDTYIYGPTGTNTTFTVAGTGILKGRHFSQIAGTTTSTFTVSGASTFQTYSAFTLSTGTFTSNTATVTIGGNFILNGGTFNATSGTMSCSAEWNRTAAATFNHNNGTVTFVGASTSSTICATAIGTETFYNLTINKDAGNTLSVAENDIFKTLGHLSLINGLASFVTTAGYFGVEGTLSIDASNWDGGNLPIKFMGTGAQTLTLPANYSADVIINKPSGTVSLSAALTISNTNQDLIITSGTLDLAGYNLTVNGSGGTFVVQTGGILQLLGTESLTTPTLNSGSIVCYNGTGTSYTLKNYTYSNLTIAAGATTVYNLPATLPSITTLTLTTGILYLNAFNITVTTLVNNATLRLKGSETMTITTMDVNSGTVEYIGANTATTYTIKDFGATDYYHLAINDANFTKATFQLGAAMVIAGNITVSGGMFNANANTFSATGSGTVNGGTYLCSTTTQTFGSGLTVSSGVFTGSSGLIDINESLTISGGTYTSNSNSTYIYGNYYQSGGTYTANGGTLVFDGVANQNVTASTALYNFNITNASGITLLSSIAIGGTLSLNSGKIALGDYNFTMNSGAALSGGGTTSFVFTGGTGQFKWASCVASSTKLFPVGHTNSSSGYTPLSITFNTGHTTDAFGVVAYNSVRSNGNRSGGTEYTSSVVKTTWDITETVSGGSNVNLQFQWNNTDEGTTLNRASCQMAHYTASAWGNVGSVLSASGSNPYTLTYTAYTGTFSPFGISGPGGPLPVDFLYLNVKKEGNVGVLNWATSTEINNNYFNIEKSLDGKLFKTIGTIYGAGNSQQTLRYAFIDSNLVIGTNYYRLKQVDYNGAFEYSTIQVINNSIGQGIVNAFKVWPVPAHEILNVAFSASTDGANTISVLNQMGNPVKSFDTDGMRGMQNIALELNDLPTGIYFLKVENLNKSVACQRFSIIK